MRDDSRSVLCLVHVARLEIADCGSVKNRQPLTTRSLIWSTALYGSESRVLKKCDEKLVTAFEMWVWHRMLRISWTERKTNTWIREKIGIPEEKGILVQIKHRKLS